VWSKYGMFMEGLHTFGDILTNIRVNCVINYMLHYYLCVYIFMVFSIYAARTCLILFQYESMHLHNVFLCLHFIYKVP
jgi:hypothetical protein